MDPNVLILIKTPKIFGKKEAKNFVSSKLFVAKQIKSIFFAEIAFQKGF